MRTALLHIIVSIFTANCAHLEAQHSYLDYQALGRFEDPAIMEATSIFQDSRGLIWMGTLKGLYRWDGIRIMSYPAISLDSVLLSEFTISSIAEDSRNNLWLSVTEHGLIKFDLVKEKFTRITIPVDSASKVIVNHVKYDLSGILWIETNLGPYTYDPEHNHLSWIHYDDTTGFIAFDTSRLIIRYNSDSFPCIADNLRDSQGNMLLSTCNGEKIIIREEDLPKSLTSDPNDTTINESFPPIIFTEFRVSRELISPGEDSPLENSILFAKHIDLSYKQNFFRIDFAAMNYDNPRNNKYGYILEGIDRDTVFSGNKSFAEYTRLKPGKYNFWVTGSDSKGVFNPAGAFIMIHIHPPWYTSYLALGGYMLLIILAVYGFIRYRTSKLWKEKILLENEVSERTAELLVKNMQITELDQLKTRYFNNISHEFRTLITLIKGPIEDAIEDAFEDKRTSQKRRASLELVRRNANRLMKLVNQLLDIAKIDKGTMNLVLIEANVFDFVYAIAVSFISLAESKGIQYRYHLPSTVTWEWFDDDKLEKIISNLLSNAFKYTDEGGKVLLELRQLEKQNGMENILEIDVSDTGHGIPKEEKEKIFDRFYQAEAHLKKVEGGTGIGLALAHDLVKLMHGTITVQSEVGSGSIFTVQIPLGKDHLKKNEFTLGEKRKEAMEESNLTDGVPVSDNEPKEKICWKGRKSGDSSLILVVEDNPEIREMLSESLEPEFIIVEAVDGSAGLKLALEQIPELIITDLMMPRMDGFELCEQLKTNVRTSHIPVIMLTAKANLDDKLRGLETGADAYIPKPFELKEVIARTRNLITQRKKLREKFGSEITLNPMEIVITPVDEKFLTRAIEVVEKHMKDEHFDVAHLCKELNMSRSTLFRKMVALVDQSPVEFIRTLRLKRAASLLKQQYGNVSEVALEVGFSSPSYFTHVFRKAYHLTPAKFAKS